MRAVFGLLAALVGGASLTAGLVPPSRGFPAVEPVAQDALLGYGALLLVLAAWALVTSGKPRRDARPVSGSSPEGEGEVAPQRSAPDVLARLRHHGWYVAKGLRLPRIDADHVVVGPAGVLCVQTQWTNAPDPRGRPAARARIAAEQLERALRGRDVHVEVVPAVVAWGPGQETVPGGVKIVDNVAVLFGDQADEWLDALTSRQLLDPALQDAVREIVADLLEDAHAVPLAAMTGDRATAATPTGE